VLKTRDADVGTEALFRAITFTDDDAVLPLHRIYAKNYENSGVRVDSLIVQGQPVDLDARGEAWYGTIAPKEARTVIRSVGGWELPEQQVSQITLWAYRGEGTVFDYSRIDLSADAILLQESTRATYGGSIAAGTITYNDGTFGVGPGAGIYAYLSGAFQPIVTDAPGLDTKTADFTAGGSRIYAINCTSGNVTAALPDANTFPMGWAYTFKRIDSSANTITIDPYSTQTIDGASTKTLTTQWEWLTIAVRAGAVNTWYVIGSG
jgi:hypothetical protein